MVTFRKLMLSVSVTFAFLVLLGWYGLALAIVLFYLLSRIEGNDGHSRHGGR